MDAFDFLIVAFLNIGKFFGRNNGLSGSADPDKDPLFKKIHGSGKTVNAIAVKAGIPQPVLYRFVNGERDLTLSTEQKLVNHFGLELRRRK